MNLQLHHVVSDITGVTGMKIIRAIVNGERNPQALATLRDVRCKSSLEDGSGSAGRQLPARAPLCTHSGIGFVRFLSSACR